MRKALYLLGCVVLGLGACRSVESKGAELPPKGSEVAAPENKVESPLVIRIRCLGRNDMHQGDASVAIRANGEFEWERENFLEGKVRCTGRMPVEMLVSWRAHWNLAKELRPTAGVPVPAGAGAIWFQFDEEAPVGISSLESVGPQDAVVSAEDFYRSDLRSLMRRIFDSVCVATWFTVSR